MKGFSERFEKFAGAKIYFVGLRANSLRPQSSFFNINAVISQNNPANPSFVQLMLI